MFPQAGRAEVSSTLPSPRHPTLQVVTSVASQSANNLRFSLWFSLLDSRYRYFRKFPRISRGASGGWGEGFWVSILYKGCSPGLLSCGVMLVKPKLLERKQFEQLKNQIDRKKRCN